MIFSSGDRDEAGANEYFSNDHGDYLMIPYGNSKGRDALDERFGVEGIPTFVICDAAGAAINKDGRAKVAAGASAAAAVHASGWEPPLIGDLAEGPGALGTDINETKAVLVCLHAADDDEQHAAAAALEPLALEYKQRAAGGDSPEVIFLVSKVAGGMADRIAALTKKHGGERCAAPCSDGNPLVLLFDIPSGGAFYVSAADAVTTAGVRAFIDAPGERHQLEN